jgi:DNA-binding CsgD family transcriptional regulator
MNPANTAPKDQQLRPGDLDVLLARMAGMVAASIGRLHTDGDGDALLKMTEVVAWHLIDALSGVVPEYRGLTPVEIAKRDGAVGIVSKLVRVSPEVLGKQIMGTFLSLRLSILAIENGAVLIPRVRVPGLLEALFHPVHRRAARRYLTRFTAATDVGPVTVDFAAAWRSGTQQPIRHQRIAPGNFVTLSGRQALVIAALIGFLMAADAWTVRANPVDMLYLAIINGGAKRWATASERVRRAITEALFVATRADIELDELRNDPTAWDRVLGEDTLDWASSVLLAFMQLTGQPTEARFSLLQFLKELERSARKAESTELIDEHLRHLHRVVINLDDEYSAPVGREDENIASIPGIQDIRNHLRRTPLTKREREVINLKAQDYDYRTIGNRLGITASTARVFVLKVRRAAGHKRLASPRHPAIRHRKPNRKQPHTGGSIMATNTGKNYREGEVRERSQVQNPRTGDFVKRNATTGEFIAVKRDGTPFKGVRKEKPQ